jgi:hypothetical protein
VNLPGYEGAQKAQNYLQPATAGNEERQIALMLAGGMIFKVKHHNFQQSDKSTLARTGRARNRSGGQLVASP